MALFPEYYILATGQPVNHVKVLAGALISCYGPTLLDRLSFYVRRKTPENKRASHILNNKSKTLLECLALSECDAKSRLWFW